MIKMNYPIADGEYKISQPFGTNPDGYPNFYQKFGYKGHNGIDFYGLKNDPIYATCDGKVTFAHYDSTGYGNLTIVEDNEGGQHYYGHQNAIPVKAGDYVKAGQKIGYMGNTGNVIRNAYSDGTHLHYGYRPAGYDKNNGYGGFVNPMPFFGYEEFPNFLKPNEQKPKSKEGWAEVVCEDGANVRLSDGSFKYETWFPKGVRIHKIGEQMVHNNLTWEKIDGGYCVARFDLTGTVMLKDVGDE